MHDPYERRLRHPADFRVSYRFYDAEEGGREVAPFQGIRSDFQFEQPYEIPGNFMIWPEFEDANGEIILDNTIPVNRAGTARMWILSDEMRFFHREEIKLGLKGFFIEGRRTAECTVIEILGLMTNPTKESKPKWRKPHT